MSFPLGRRYVTKTLMVSEPLKTVFKIMTPGSLFGETEIGACDFQEEKVRQKHCGTRRKIGRSMPNVWSFNEL